MNECVPNPVGNPIRFAACLVAALGCTARDARAPSALPAGAASLFKSLIVALAVIIILGVVAVVGY